MSEQPHWGFTRLGLPVHARAADHHKGAFNKKAAVAITNVVGSMVCAYVFAVLALVSLPAILTQAFSLHVFPTWMISASLISLVAWISSYFLQLVLLPIIIVGQNVQAEAGDARAEKTFTDVETVMDRLDTRTQGGITEILQHVDDLNARTADLAQVVQQVMAARAEHDSAVSIDAKAARTAAESANVVMQVLAAQATGTTGPQPVLKPASPPAGSAGTAGKGRS